MRLATMVAGDFPDVRCGRITTAMRLHGWRHDVVSRGYPPQFEDAYESIDWYPYRKGFTEALAKSEGELFHVHGELHHYFPVMDAKETGKPVILNVHDLTCSRSESILDAFEAECIAAADALVWVTEEQRDFARAMGLDVDKPSCVIPNYVSSVSLIDRPVLPHIGGIAYEGGIDARGNIANDRDFSAVADALGGDFHIYPGGSVMPDYGIVHETELDYHILIHRLAQHDWGLAGYPEAVESWLHADPTKAYDYLAAGIPVIAMNTPKLIPLVEDGMAVWAESLGDLKRILKMDADDYKKRVIANRRKYTTERVIEPLVRLYEEVLS